MAAMAEDQADPAPVAPGTAADGDSKCSVCNLGRSRACMASASPHTEIINGLVAQGKTVKVTGKYGAYFSRALKAAPTDLDPLAVVPCCDLVFCHLCFVGVNDSTASIVPKKSAADRKKQVKPPPPLVRTPAVWVGTFGLAKASSTTGIKHHVDAFHATPECGAIVEDSVGTSGRGGSGSGGAAGTPAAVPQGARLSVAVDSTSPRPDSYQSRRTLELPSGPYELPLPESALLIKQARGGAGSVQPPEFDMIIRAITLFAVGRYASVTSILAGVRLLRAGY
jgi:hypothetical protein